jgi:type I restriction enzyme S subunit
MDTKKLRQKILDLAIRGKLIPQDPNDEPASVLIEKIRVEKEQLIKEKKIKRDKNESYIYRSDKSYYEKFADGTTKCIDEEIPFGIPESWEWCRLGSIAKNVLYGVSKSAQTEGDYRLLRITDIQNNSVDWENVPFTTLPKEKVSEYLLEQHDILFARTGATVGKSYLVNEVNNNVIYASYLIRVRLFEMFNSQYIKFYFESGFYWGQVTDKSVGVGQPNVNGTSLKSLLIPIPPYEEQLLIGKQALELTDIIHNINNSQKDLSDYIQDTKSKILDLAIQGKLVPQNPSDEPASVLLERIKSEYPNSKKKVSKTSDNSHYENLPQGWAKCTLENIGSWSAGSTPSRSNKVYYENGTVNWLKTGDLNDGYIDYIPEKITDLALKECSVRLNPKDSVLIAMYGATIGKIGILNIPATTNQACCACITYPGIYNKFLFYLLMSKKRILQMKGEGGAQPNISKDKIINFPILLPPSLEQKRIVQTIENLFQQLDNIISGL